MDNGQKQPETRWEALKEVMDNGLYREAIGYAWPLYFYAVFHGDKEKQLITNYPELKRKLSAPISTIARWKDRLVEQKVAVSIQGKHQWNLKLLPPYDAPLTCLKTDGTEIVIKSDSTTQKLIKRMFSTESPSLLPIIAELAHKVDRLEQLR